MVMSSTAFGPLVEPKGVQKLAGGGVTRRGLLGGLAALGIAGAAKKAVGPLSHAVAPKIVKVAPHVVPPEAYETLGKHMPHYDDVWSTIENEIGEHIPFPDDASDYLVHVDDAMNDLIRGGEQKFLTPEARAAVMKEHVAPAVEQTIKDHNLTPEQAQTLRQHAESLLPKHVEVHSNIENSSRDTPSYNTLEELDREAPPGVDPQAWRSFHKGAFPADHADVTVNRGNEPQSRTAEEAREEYDRINNSPEVQKWLKGNAPPDDEGFKGYAEGGPLIRKAGQSIRSGLAHLIPQRRTQIIRPGEDRDALPDLQEALRNSRSLVRRYSSSPRNPAIANPEDRNALGTMEGALGETFNDDPYIKEHPVHGLFYLNQRPDAASTDFMSAAANVAPSWADDSAMELKFLGSIAKGGGRDMLHDLRALPALKGKPLVLDMIDTPHTAQFYKGMGFEPGKRLVQAPPQNLEESGFAPDEIKSYRGFGADWPYDFVLPPDKPLARAEGGPTERLSSGDHRELSDVMPGGAVDIDEVIRAMPSLHDMSANRATKNKDGVVELVRDPDIQQSSWKCKAKGGAVRGWKRA